MGDPDTPESALRLYMKSAQTLHVKPAYYLCPSPRDGNK